MVVRSVVKLARLTAPKQFGSFKGIAADYSLPATNWKELKHHSGLIPMHTFTAIGMVFCGWYIWKLCSFKDSMLFKDQNPPNVKPNEQISVFFMSGNMTEEPLPVNRPELPVYNPNKMVEE